MSVEVPHGQQCPHCGRFDNRGMSVDMIIIRDGQILLGKRGGEPFKSWWALFGGFVEWGESAEDAAARETKEESNLIVVSSKLVGFYSKPERAPHQVMTALYVVECEGEEKAGDDIVEVKWWSLDDLPELAFDHRTLLEDYLATV